MKLSVFLCGLFLSLPAAVSAADNFPKRKAGLWEIRVVSQGQTQVMKQCVGPDTDSELNSLAGQFGQQCSEMKLRRMGSAYVADSDCSIMGTRVRSKSRFDGDFSAGYSGEVVSSYDPPLMGMRESSTRITARMLGPCQAGQQPGDILMPNGMKMNMDMLKQMSKPDAKIDLDALKKLSRPK
jgi:hypothetical protein